MSLDELKNLKELSWYTTIPLIVCAWFMQDMSIAQAEMLSISDFVLLVGSYFLKVVVGLIFAFAVWLFAVVHIEKDSFPFTLLLATFILTISSVGFAIYVTKPPQLSLPVNIVWFAALASVAFNLYEIKSGAHNRKSIEDINS